MLKKKGRIWKASGTGGLVVYIPTDLVNDSAFPFKVREYVDVEIDPNGKRLIITKRERNEV